ncbi:MAG: hypothetical protein ACKO7G_04315 [Gammaproteobacteria bacterium]
MSALAGLFLSRLIECRINGIFVGEVHPQRPRTGGPGEVLRRDFFDMAGERLREQVGHQPTEGTTVACLDGLEFPEDGVVDVDRGAHGA